MKQRVLVFHSAFRIPHWKDSPVTKPTDQTDIRADVETLERLGYKQELHRGLSGFSNYALSLSIICILAGCITSFHIGLGSVGGAALGLGWPLFGLFALLVALAMGQVASAFPTAGGLYHWAAILGGRGWGWATAWLNLAGLITVLAAINVGAYQFLASALGFDLESLSVSIRVLCQTLVVFVLTASQAGFNHFGIRLTTRLTDFSGYWILFVTVVLTGVLLGSISTFEPGRLIAFDNLSGLPNSEPTWPQTTNVAWLFLLGLLLPAYTLTGFDASAHVSEETVRAAVEVPRGMVRSVLVSGVFGWVLVGTLVLAAPDLKEAAEQKEGAFAWIVNARVTPWLAVLLYVGIGVAQYLCGLATVTSASRMVFAFARDGGLPFAASLRWVSPIYRTPVWSIWTAAGLSLLFTLCTPVYDTITAAAASFLYQSYVVPITLGALAYRRTWTKMGPWDLGIWYRPLAVVCLLGCGLLFVVGIQPPNQTNLLTLGGSGLLLFVVWFAVERKRFRGPPRLLHGKPGSAFDEDRPAS